MDSNRIVIDGVKRLEDEQLCTIVIQDGIIESITDSTASSTAKHIAVPGMCDLYTRLREPGLTSKGTIESEATAAFAAGFTQVLCSPDTLPAIDNVATVELIRQRAQLAKGARVLPIAALTIGLQGEQLSELATLQAIGCPAAGQADMPLDNTNVLFSAMEYAASFNLPLFMTARHTQLGAYGCAHEGAMATRLGLPGIPVAAETVALAVLLEICRATGCRLHISRVSSARALQMIDSAKQAALPVTCDVGLHHLFFTDEHLAGYDSSFNSAVPFRSIADRDALRAGVSSGVIDAICSDHSPHEKDASLAPFPSTDPGLSAYQWAIPLILQLPALLDLSLNQVFEKLTHAPRRIIDGSHQAGLEVGEVADFFLLALDEDASQGVEDAQQTATNHPLNIHTAEALDLTPLKGRVSAVYSQLRQYRP